jgi:hypothetical protein
MKHVKPITYDVKNALEHEGDQLSSIPKALIEFSENAMQYRDKSVAAFVQITLGFKGGKLKKLEIADNGYGMDEDDFEAFFHCHGTNRERLAGKPGRGKFGLGGKQAIMGLGAKKARIESVKNGILHVVEWSRDDHANYAYEKKGTTDRPNGTSILLGGMDRKVDLDQIKKTLRREHRNDLGHNVMTVNGDRLSYTAPTFDREETYRPPAELISLIGNPVLTLRSTLEPLSKEERGVQIMANNVLHEDNYLGDFTTRPQAARVYGSVDVPFLEIEDEEGVPAYSSERSQQLKRDNQRVGVLLPWINSCLASFIRILEEEHQKILDAKNTEELQRQADALSSVLTDAWRGLDITLPRRKSTPNGINTPELSGIEAPTDPIPGDETPAYRFTKDGDVNITETPNGDIFILSKGDHGVGGGKRTGTGSASVQLGVVDDSGDPATLVKKVTKQRHSTAKIEVTLEHLTSAFPRATWDANECRLTLNLDTEELAGMDFESDLFREKGTQIAIAEFAVVLVQTKSNSNTSEFDPRQPIEVLEAVRGAQNQLGKAFHAAKASPVVTSDIPTEVAPNNPASSPQTTVS